MSYGLSTDVLGRLVEVVSGQPLGAFLRARVFEPLSMHDTEFHVDAEGRARLATAYRTDSGAPQAISDGPHQEGPLVYSPSYPYAGARRYESGGAGLVTTALDYARFCRMLAEGGTLDGVRVLGRKTVELMTADHLAALTTPPGLAVGLGVSIAADPGRSGAITSAGTWSWDGFYTTRFWIDPAEDLVGVILTQTYPYNHGRVLDRLMAVAYQALE
jgi:CubicO group peptidase (beta-lactamase class C family)